MKHRKINKSNYAKFFAVAGTGLVMSAFSANAQIPETVRTEASAIAVDTELLLLVDVSQSIDSSEYSLMMNGYRDAFTSGSFLDEVQAGEIGSIAVALMFWSGASSQELAVGWTEINDQTSANGFASLIDNTVRSFSGKTAIGSAIDAGTISFGTETGNAQNGFYSQVQIIDISGDGEDNDTPPEGDRALNVRTARDASLADGVDMINALVIGNDGGNLEQYFIDNVIAGGSDSSDPFTQAASFETLASSLEAKLARELTAATEIDDEMVPEPSSTLLLGLTGLLGMLRRKR